jgi:hypothetical protein
MIHPGIEEIEEPVTSLPAHTPAVETPFRWDEEEES